MESRNIFFSCSVINFSLGAEKTKRGRKSLRLSKYENIETQIRTFSRYASNTSLVPRA